MANAFDHLDEGATEPTGNAFDHLDGPTQANAFDHLGTGPAPETGMDIAEGLAQSAAQGATLGYGDEIAAAMGSLGGLGPKLLGTKSYDQILDDVRGRGKKFEAAHPVASTAAQIGGALVVPGGAAKAALAKGAPTLARAIASGAKVGLGTGLAQGFGSGEGGMENRLANAGKTGAASAAAGALAPVAGTVARKTVNAAVPYAQAAAKEILGRPYRTVMDGLLAHYTGGLSVPITTAKRAYDVAKSGNQIRRSTAPMLGDRLGLGPLIPAAAIAGSDIYSMDLQ